MKKPIYDLRVYGALDTVSPTPPSEDLRGLLKHFRDGVPVSATANFRRIIMMSKVPLSISLLDWFFLSINLSTRSSMEIDDAPLEILWEETCESTLAAIGQFDENNQYGVTGADAPTVG